MEVQRQDRLPRGRLGPYYLIPAAYAISAMSKTKLKGKEMLIFFS